MSTQLTYPLLITVHPVQHLNIGSEVVILFDDVRSVVLQHDFYAYERHIHSDCLNASLGGNPHLRQSNPIRYFADAMRSIFLKGAGLRDNCLNLCCLLVQGLLFTFFAVNSYKKTK